MLANLRRQQEQPKTTAPSIAEQPKTGLATLMRRGLPLPLVKTITRLWTGAGRPEGNTPDRVMSTMASSACSASASGSCFPE